MAIFDLDNTLVDRDAAFVRWCEVFRDEFRLPVTVTPLLLEADEGGFRDRLEFSRDIRERLALNDSPEELLERFWATFPQLFAADEGVPEGLRDLRRHGWTIGIATNGGPYQHAKLAAAQLSSLVDVVCASAVEGVAKPDRRLLDLAAERSGTTLGPADWMVGDAEVDVLAGHNAGVRTIWIERGRRWENSAFAPHLSTGTTKAAIRAILE